MRVIIQRVKEASVVVAQEKVATIEKGFLILLGIETQDTKEDANWLCGKVARLRIFEDEAGIMNLPITAVHGGVIVVSQFTLHASTKKGNRPSFIKAARPEIATPLYQYFVQTLQGELGREVQTGTFGAMMDVQLVNDGPVTIFIDSQNRE